MTHEAMLRPPQTQDSPGATDAMVPRPRDSMESYVGSGLLTGARALITGGDSGIGRAVAVAFAKEGADICFGYLCEDDDAARTRELVTEQDSRCWSWAIDLGVESGCQDLVARSVAELGGLDVVVNNVATQTPQGDPAGISSEQWRRTFAVNVDSYFWVTRAALPHLRRGTSIVNTGSVNGLRGNPDLVDYSASKGAVLGLTYALARALLPRGIRVNCVAPGPV